MLFALHTMKLIHCVQTIRTPPFTRTTNYDPQIKKQMAKNNDNNDSSCKIITDDENKDEEETNYIYASQLVNSCALPMVMKATVNMGVLQLIHDHATPTGLSTVEIATRIKIPNPNGPAMLDRMLRLLATYSVVRCTTVVSTVDGGRIDRLYSPSPMTKFFVSTADDCVSLAALLNLFHDKVVLDSWTKLEEAVVGGGIPFEMAHGMKIFEYARADSRFNEVLSNAMYQSTSFFAKKIMEKYKGLDNIQQVVDVGGGLGLTVHVITSIYPSIKAINFDLPHVIQNALPCTGVEHVSGDMFESIPKGDAIFMKWILHNWSDEHCLKILKNCYKALPKNGKVIVVDGIMEDEAESTTSSRATNQTDQALTLASGGKERSRQQFEALAKASGFSNLNFVCCVYNFWVMEFYK